MRAITEEVTLSTVLTNMTQSTMDSSLILNSTSQTTTDNYYPNYLKIWNSGKVAYYKYVIFSLIMAMSFFGNLLVILTISLTQQLKNVTNYFLFNMAVADILVTVSCMPIHLVSWFDHAVTLGRLTCKAMPFLQGTSISCTIYTLTVIAIDRYRVILRPLGTRIRKNQCIMILMFIWSASMLTVSPSLFVYRVGIDEKTNVKRCDEYGWSRQQSISFTYTLMTLTYVLPLMFLLLIYGRIFLFLWYREIPGIKEMPEAIQSRMRKKCLRRKRLVRMLVAVVVTFMLCHLPQNILTFLWYSGEEIGWEPPLYMGIIAFHAEIILYMNAAVNPLVYGFLHGKTKTSSYATLRFILCCEKIVASGDAKRNTKISSLGSNHFSIRYKVSTVERPFINNNRDKGCTCAVDV